MLDNQNISEALGICDEFSKCEGLLINPLYFDRESSFIPNKSVILATSGRLGNQFFQYSAAYSLAKKTGSNLYIFDQECASCYLKSKSLDVEYYLTKFNISKEVVIIPFSNESVELRKNLYPNNNNPFSVENKGLMQANWEYVKQDNYYELMENKNDKILILADFFCHSRYFSSFYNEIIEQFALSEFNTSNIEDILNDVQQNNSICIHFRGTDYLKFKSFIPMDFQKLAMNFVQSEKLLDNPRYFVITDDIPIAKSSLQEYDDIEYIRETTTLEAFYILRNCRNNIITKSTFGWWGAFLNRKSDFTIMPCDNIDSFKDDHLTYKIQYKIDNIDKCEGLYLWNNYTIQYRDVEGNRVFKYKNKRDEWVFKIK